MMFLLVYHVPVLCGLGLVMVALRAAGILDWGQGMDLTPIATLLFLGPLLELAGGLLVSRAPRNAALGVLLFLPMFVLFTIVCSKAWLDGIVGRPYTWVKTERSGHGQSPLPSRPECPGTEPTGDPWHEPPRRRRADAPRPHVRGDDRDSSRSSSTRGGIGRPTSSRARWGAWARAVRARHSGTASS